MSKRAIFWVLVIAAVLGVAVAVTARSSHAQGAAPGAAPGAADECLSKPNAPPPQGSHWYYRSDRANNRRCWYLGPQGTKVIQPSSSKERPSAKPAPEPQVEPVEAPAETIAGSSAPNAPPNTSMSAGPLPWSALPTLSAAIERQPASSSDGVADVPSEPPAQDEMPLIWPVLTAADLAPADASTGMSGQTLALGLVLVAAALAFAAVLGRKVFELLAVRRVRLRRAALRPLSDSAVPARALHNPVVRAPPIAPRHAEFPHRPAPRRDPNIDFGSFAVEDPEAEASLRRLVHNWRRAAA